MPQTATLRRAAPAKLNLYLHIEGHRADGYHLVDSLIAFAGIGDVVDVSPDDALELTVDGPFAADVPAGGDNLVLRAATALRQQMRAEAGAAIRLTKNLPVASGIGGGSADAAAALRALSSLWRDTDDAFADAAIAGRLGADVPVCWYGFAARVAGIGDEIAAVVDLPPVALVLANPGVALSTPEVFRRYDADPVAAGSATVGDWTGIADAGRLADRLAATRNDLEPAAIALAPAVAETLSALRATAGCLLARMSGSGATCFGVFADDGAARSAAGALRTAHPGWWVEATRLRAAPPAVERL